MVSSETRSLRNVAFSIERRFFGLAAGAWKIGAQLHGMTIANDIHFVLAFLVALCALVFSWNALGRRVMNAVLGVQVLVGAALVAIHIGSHEALPSRVGLHGGLALCALICYGAASVLTKRGKGNAALLLSVLGLLLVGATLYLGSQFMFHSEL